MKNFYNLGARSLDKSVIKKKFFFIPDTTHVVVLKRTVSMR